MQKLLKGGAKGELSLARDHRSAFPKIDETRNAQGPLNFPHTYQISVYNVVRFNDLRICTPVFFVVEFSECGKSSRLNHLRNESSCLPEFHSEVWVKHPFYKL